MINSLVNKFGGRIIVTGPSNGTQYIEINGNKIGYINPTTRKKGAIFGLRLKFPRESNGFRPSEKNEVLQYLHNEYGEIPRDWLYTEVSKDNTYILIKSENYAEKIMEKSVNPESITAHRENNSKNDNSDIKEFPRSRPEFVNENPEYKGIKFNTDWNENNSLDVESLPNSPGIYAEIYWETKGVRIGETGRSIRGKIKHDIGWFNSMHDRSAPAEQLRRTIPIAEVAKKFGSKVFSFYVVSQDSRLEDKEIRQECERFLFQWVEENPRYINWNFQKSWR